MRASCLISAMALATVVAAPPVLAYEEERTQSESTYRSNGDLGSPDSQATRELQDRTSDQTTIERRSTTIEQQAVTPSEPPPGVLAPVEPPVQQQPSTTYEERKSLSIGK